MLQKEYLKIKDIALHKVGNKLNQDGIILSRSTLNFDDEVKELLIKYFITPFRSDEYHHLHHDIDLQENPVYAAVSRIFDEPGSLFDQSVLLARHLYEQSHHPKIKGGEFYVVYFTDCMLGNEQLEAVGLFKSETKETFLKVYPSEDGFEIGSESGININKLDKGCLIFNTEREEGFRIAIIDNTNRGNEAKYWADSFLRVSRRRDSFHDTSQVLSLCRDFVSEVLPQEHPVHKGEQAILLNRSMEALRNEKVDMADFAREVFEKPEIIDQFNRYKQSYQQERDIEIRDQFTPAPDALKRKGMGTMTSIRLDRNFNIQVYGGDQLIERGYDEARGMYYYRLYFREEE